MDVIEDLKNLLDYLENEDKGEFAAWVNSETEESYEMDFITWTKKHLKSI